MRVLEHQLQLLSDSLTTMQTEIDRLTNVEEDVIRLERRLDDAHDRIATLQRGRLVRIETSVTRLRQVFEPPIYAKGDRVIITNTIKQKSKKGKKISDKMWCNIEYMVRRGTIERIEPGRGTKPEKIHIRTDIGVLTWRYAKNLKRNSWKGSSTALVF